MIVDEKYFHETDIILFCIHENWDNFNTKSQKMYSIFDGFFYAHHFYILNKTLSYGKTDLCNGYQNTMNFIPDKNGKIKT